MSPTAIASKAWEDRHDRAPLDSIMEALGLPEIPNVVRNGAGVVNHWTACLTAFEKHVQANGGHRAALPDTSHRQGGTGKAKRVKWACARPGCDTVEMVPPGEAERRTYCSRQCVGMMPKPKRKPRPTPKAKVERNLEIVKHRQSELSLREVADEVGVSHGTVQVVLREWRNGTGWARWVDTDMDRAA